MVELDGEDGLQHQELHTVHLLKGVAGAVLMELACQCFTRRVNGSLLFGLSHQSAGKRSARDEETGTVWRWPVFLGKQHHLKERFRCI